VRGGPKELWFIIANTRKRAIPPKGNFGGTLASWRVGPGQNPSVTYARNYPGAPKVWQGSQVTVSENHPAWKRVRKDTFQGDQGGDFTTTKVYLEGDSIPESTLSGSVVVIPPSVFTKATYTGSILPTQPSNMPFPPNQSSSDQALANWGTKAIAACKPTNSVADVSTFLGELLRDGIPSLVGSSVHAWESITDALRGAGDEFLNVEFGWLPFQRDVTNFATAVVDADRVLAQYERDAGKVVRRRFRFEPVVVNSASVVASNAAPYIWVDHSALHQTGVGQGRVLRLLTETTERWFSGAFTYYLPKGADSIRSRLGKAVQQAKHLLGLTLTPETIWNLTPWSWATDWLLNTGDVLSNVSDWAIDGLVLKYGYIMEHSKTVDRYSFAGPTDFQSEAARPSVITLVNETKKRRKATPFGFGLTWDGFTAQQAAIAAAIGVTR
jgi:hypothetical protein